MTQTRYRFALLVFAFGICCALDTQPALAQSQTTGALAGSVSDVSTLAGIPGATVMIKNIGSGEVGRDNV